MTRADGGAAVVAGYDDVKSLGSDLQDGNVFAAGKDLYDLGGLAGDVDKFASGAQDNILGDPLNELISAGLDFLIDLIAPLKDALNAVTGDPDGLNDKAAEWAAVAASLRQLGPRTASDAQATAGDWTGQAGDAFRAKIGRFEQGASAVAGQADHVADVLRISATLMDSAQSIIKGIISSWVEYAIITEAAAAASAAFTFGASEAAGQAAVAGEASVACGEGAETVGQASSLLERVGSVLKQLEGSMGELGRAMEEEAASLRQVESGLKTASEKLAEQSAEKATEALKDGVKDSLKDGAIDGLLGLGDDALHSDESQDGQESQAQINRDLTFD